MLHRVVSTESFLYIGFGKLFSGSRGIQKKLMYIFIRHCIKKCDTTHKKSILLSIHLIILSWVRLPYRKGSVNAYLSGKSFHFAVCLVVTRYLRDEHERVAESGQIVWGDTVTQPSKNHIYVFIFKTSSDPILNSPHQRYVCGCRTSVFNWYIFIIST